MDLDSHRVVIDDTPIAYLERGDGSPTVVLEAGLGDGIDSWQGVLDPLSSMTKVFAYNRPGYPPSGKTNRPRTPDHIVDDLRALLARSGHPPPYLLVGHSLGGLYMLRFAERYPEEVAGLVLIDARHPLFTQACQQRGLRLCTLPAAIRMMTPSHVLNEYDAVRALNPPATLGSMPLAVVSRGEFGVLETEAWQALWAEMQLGLSELSSRSRYRIADNAGHAVHQEAPEAVLEAVAWVMGQTRDAGQ